MLLSVSVVKDYCLINILCLESFCAKYWLTKRFKCGILKHSKSNLSKKKEKWNPTQLGFATLNREQGKRHLKINISAVVIISQLFSGNENLPTTVTKILINVKCKHVSTPSNVLHSRFWGALREIPKHGPKFFHHVVYGLQIH